MLQACRRYRFVKCTLPRLYFHWSDEDTSCSDIVFWGTGPTLGTLEESVQRREYSRGGLQLSGFIWSCSYYQTSGGPTSPPASLSAGPEATQRWLCKYLYYYCAGSVYCRPCDRQWFAVYASCDRFCIVHLQFMFHTQLWWGNNVIMWWSLVGLSISHVYGVCTQISAVCLTSYVPVESTICEYFSLSPRKTHEATSSSVTSLMAFYLQEILSIILYTPMFVHLPEI